MKPSVAQTLSPAGSCLVDITRTVVITGTHIDNVDRSLSLFQCTNVP